MDTQTGLSVTYALGITNELGWMVRQSTEAEANMNSIERIETYANLASEAPSEQAADAAVINKTAWPAEGRIVFTDVCLRYIYVCACVCVCVCLRVCVNKTRMTLACVCEQDADVCVDKRQKDADDVGMCV